MKYVCLGYMPENAWDSKSQNERDAMIKECLDYDNTLRKNGNLVGAEALQSVRTAATVRWQNGRPTVTDGPFAETKEQLGGVLVLEAKDLNHAIQFISQHPGVRYGVTLEIRPTEEIPGNPEN